MIAPSSTGKTDAKNVVTDAMALAANVLQALADDSARIIGMQYANENLLLLFPGDPTTFVRLSSTVMLSTITSSRFCVLLFHVVCHVTVL